MPNLINQDSFGNTYFNYFDALTNGEGSNDVYNSIFTFLQTAYGSSRVSYVNNQSYYVIPNHPDETLTTPASASRFRHWFTNANNITSLIDTQTSNGANAVATVRHMSNTNGPWIVQQSTAYLYGVANQYGFCLSQMIGPNSSTPGTTQYYVMYMGTLKNPGFSGSNYPLNYSILYSAYSSLALTQYTIASRVSSVNASAPVTAYSTSGSVANYSITCTNATTNATTTDLILRDNASPNYAIGSCYNLLKTSASVTVGSIYEVPNVVDGNTEQKRWLCVGNWGSEKILMRVWTEGLG